MKYDKEFEESWKYNNYWFTRMEKEYAWEVWQASRRDLYKIGEMVEVKHRLEGAFHSGTVYVQDNKEGIIYGDTNNYDVRKIPPWKPKEGDAIFVIKGSVVLVAKVLCIGNNENIIIRHQTGTEESIKIEKLKPFLSSNIGKPWDEI